MGLKSTPRRSRAPRRGWRPHLNPMEGHMTDYAQGTVLTCTHDDCLCRIRVETECHCTSAGDPYRCTCGAPMVEVVEPDGEAAESSGAPA